jgi:Domain of unknown function (DUF4282)
MYCIHCGASNRDDLKTCVNCGEQLDDDNDEGKLSRLRFLKNLSLLNKVDFLRRLFDFSFGQLISLKMIRFLYALSILSAGIIALSVVILGLKISMGFGMIAFFIGAPLIFLLSVVSCRIFLEMALLVFHLSDPLDKMEEKQKSKDNLEWRI